MKARIVVIKLNDIEYIAHGNDEATDVELVNYLEENFSNVKGDIYFVQAELPAKPLGLVGEVVV